VISVNAFSSDTEAEKKLVYAHCEKLGVPVALSYGWADEGKGCIELAEKVVAAAEKCEKSFIPTYDLEDSPLLKIRKNMQNNIWSKQGCTFCNSKKTIKKIRRFRI